MIVKWMPVVCAAVCTLAFMVCQADEATAVNPEKKLKETENYPIIDSWLYYYPESIKKKFKN